MLRIVNKLLLVMLLSIFCYSICFADTATDSAKKEALQKLFKVTRLEKAFPPIQEVVLQSMLTQKYRAVIQSNYAEVKEIVNKYLPVEKDKAIIFEGYAKYYSTNELERIVKIYSDPLIEKFIKLNPEIIHKINEAKRDLLKSNLPKINHDLSELFLTSMQKKAKLGVVDAQYELGRYYLDTKKNEKMGFYWLEQAANNDNVWAMNDLALAYDHGLGTQKNLKEAIKWYERAAEAGDEVGMFNLGLQYFYGNGIDKNYQQAFKWFTKSAYFGGLYAKVMLAKCYFLGFGVKKDEVQGENWLLLAAHNYYNPRFDDKVKIRNHYIDTFLIYQKSQFFGTVPKYQAGMNEDMIKQAEEFGALIQKTCSITTYASGS